MAESLRNPMGGSFRKRLAAIGAALGIGASGVVGGGISPPAGSEGQLPPSPIVSQGEGSTPRPFGANSKVELSAKPLTPEQPAAETFGFTPESSPESTLIPPTRTSEPLPSPEPTPSPAPQTTPESTGTISPEPFASIDTAVSGTPKFTPQETSAPTSGIDTGVEATPIPPPEDRQELERLINGQHPPVSAEQLLNDIKAVYSSSPKAEQIWSQQYAIYDAQVTGEDEQAAKLTLAFNLNEIYVKIKSPLSYNAMQSAIYIIIDKFGDAGKKELLRIFQIRK